MGFKNDEEWEKHVEKFYYLVSKLSDYDKPMSPEKSIKANASYTKPFCTCSYGGRVHFVSSEKVIASFKAEISRRRTSKNSLKASKHVPTSAE